MHTHINRQQAVRRYSELTFSNTDLNNFTSLASEICEASIVVISLVEDGEEKFIATKGTNQRGIVLNESLSVYPLLHDHVLTIADVSNHKRFVNTDLATIDPQMRFYAGVALISPDGYAVGRLYVLDKRPKQLTKAQENCLQFLANQVIQCLEKEIICRSLQQQLKERTSVLSNKNIISAFLPYR